MPGDESHGKIHTLPFVPPVFNWSAQNLYMQFRIFKTKVQFAFNGMYKNNSNDAKVGVILNWMGDSAFEVYNNFVWGSPADKDDPNKVLTQFENYFKLAQNVYHCWYMLGELYSSQFKSQSDFMIRLRDVVKDCQFEKPDEIVKFLFLTDNQNPKVREELLKSMKEGDRLNDILGYAHLVEGNQHSEHLCKVYLDSVKPSNKTVDAVEKKAKKKFQEDPSHIRIQSLGPSPETIRRDAIIVVPSTSLNIALPLARNVIIVKRKITFLKYVQGGIIAKAMAMVTDLNLKVPDSVVKTIMS